MDPIPIAPRLAPTAGAALTAARKTAAAGEDAAARPAGETTGARPAGETAGAQAAGENAATRAADETAGARAAAEAFETAFVAEMLKYSGVNKTPAAFGGGAGEDAFGSFLTQEYARLISARGGLGLAEQIFEAMKQKAPAP